MAIASVCSRNLKFGNMKTVISNVDPEVGRICREALISKLGEEGCEYVLLINGKEEVSKKKTPPPSEERIHEETSESKPRETRKYKPRKKGR